MFTGSTVAAINMTASASIGISSVDIEGSPWIVLVGTCAGEAMIRAGQRTQMRGELTQWSIGLANFDREAAHCQVPL